MKILAIETSCDETSIALIEKFENRKYKVISHETISQINLHREFGGVYPTLSRREHEKNLIPLLHKVLKDGDLIKVNITSKENLLEIIGTDLELIERYEDLKENLFDFFTKFSVSGIDYIAVTNGPGLPPALWVGVNFAKIISVIVSGNKPIPIYPINHMEGHIIGGLTELKESVAYTSNLEYPALTLLISGGHTEIVLSNKENSYTKVGETVDDAIGEAYDKVARLLGLPYPGGPEIARLAKDIRDSGNLPTFKFPRPMLHSHNLNFSFSGIKTHILYFIQDYLKKNNLETLPEELKNQIAYEFEEAAKDVLIKKLGDAISEYGVRSVVVGGGVASNIYLKESIKSLCNSLGVEIHLSDRLLATDNALMIALTCALKIEANITPSENFIAVGSKNYEWQ